MTNKTSKDAPLYFAIAEEIAAAIHRGALGPGDKLPSIRQLKEIKRVSIPTIQEALRRLEDRGLIEAKTRSGYYVKYPSEHHRRPAAGRMPKGPVTVDVLQLTAPILNASAEPHLLPFGAAIPSPELFPTDRLRKALSTHLRVSGSSIGTYSFAPGSLTLRTEVARRAMLWDCRFDPKNVVITNGCVEAVGLALKAVTKPGDIVAIESPGYYGFFQMLEMLNLRAVEIPSSMPDGMSLDLLAKALEQHDIKACLISTTVSNPSGATMTLEDKKRLVTLLEQRDIPLIEDATFADLHFDGSAAAAKSFDTKGNVLLCASLTKTIAPGLRMGWIEGGRYAEKIAFLKRVTSIAQSEIIEGGLAKYLAEGGVDRHLRTLRSRLRDQLDRHILAISQHLPKEVRFSRPSGGFLLWLQWPTEVDTLKLHRQALDVGVGLAPGLLFSASGQFQHHMRVNCGQVWRPEIEDAYRNLATLARQMS